MSAAPNKKRMAITAGVVVAAVAGMAGLAAAAAPLYDAFCKLTGYGGTTQEAAAAPGQVLDRRIEVRFDSNVAPGLPIEFEPKQISQTLRIGETGLAFYTVRNLSDQPVVARATYNVTPHEAGQYFAKLECFCFQDRLIGPGEAAELPVVFFVDPEIASDLNTAEIGTLTLSYTFFRSTDQSAAETAS
ncbi:MAG TPA: cytochrome c oxidase assembly protein [Vitreimonas sp.]|uniref:cytochrome c oxidase assembly protein n=1 Tax=Vitreimonas sp. TaxID=3069702 RepID=UPI002D3E20D2|nr:cytochrome c oxidase assembly protein [Vitreimonas sp.]HYD87281.1 cytochrome c oxidase assembly protein [Vitreimonas sp.]